MFRIRSYALLAALVLVWAIALPALADIVAPSGTALATQIARDGQQLEADTKVGASVDVVRADQQRLAADIAATGASAPGQPESAPAPSAFSVLVTQYVLPSLNTLLEALAAAAVTFAVAWLNAHLKAKGIQISAAQEAQLQGWAAKGVAFAEEKGAALADAKLAGADPTKGSAKLQMATEFVLTAAQSAGVKSLTPEQAQAAIHAALGSLAGVGASGAKAVPAPVAA